MKKIQGLWRGVGSGNIILFTSKPEKTPNMKIKYGHKQRGIRRKDRTQKDATRNDYNISLENTQNMKMKYGQQRGI